MDKTGNEGTVPSGMLPESDPAGIETLFDKNILPGKLTWTRP